MLVVMMECRKEIGGEVLYNLSLCVCVCVCDSGQASLHVIVSTAQHST